MIIHTEDCRGGRKLCPQLRSGQWRERKEHSPLSSSRGPLESGYFAAIGIISSSDEFVMGGFIGAAELPAFWGIQAQATLTDPPPWQYPPWRRHRLAPGWTRRFPRPQPSHCLPESELRPPAPGYRGGPVARRRPVRLCASETR